MPSQPQPYELLVFDWDGTLMDSVASIVACTQRALAELGLDAVGDEVIRGSIGLGLSDSLTRLFPDGLPVPGERLLECYRRHWFGSYRERPVLFAGVREAIATLGQAGYLLAVATGKSRAGLQRDLERTGLGPSFLATRTVDEAPSKPHPQMLLDLCGELGVEPRRTLMIGDTTFDLEMARHAGAASVGVLTGSHAHEELLDWGPLACLESAAQVPRWLEATAAERLVVTTAPAGG